MSKPKDAFTREVLEHAQFNNGSLDILLQGPESELGRDADYEAAFFLM